MPAKSKAQQQLFGIAWCNFMLLRINVKFYVKDLYYLYKQKYYNIMKELKEFLTETKHKDFDKEIKKLNIYSKNWISDELHRHIKDNFREVPCKIFGKWYKVYNGDSKYGQYMVNFDKELWTHVSFDEFYGGAVVD